MPDAGERVTVAVRRLDEALRLLGGIGPDQQDGDDA